MSRQTPTLILARAPEELRLAPSHRGFSVDIELSQNNGQFTARVMQDEQLMCACTLEVAATRPGGLLSVAQATTPCRRQDCLHKTRKENVLVGDIDPQAQVQSLAVAAGQFFENGHSSITPSSSNCSPTAS